MKLKPFLILAFIFLSLNCFSQKNEQEKIDSLKLVLKNFNSGCSPCLKDSAKVNILIEIVSQLSLIHPDSALPFVEEALNLSEKIKWNTGMGRMYHQKGNYYYQRGEYEDAINFYNKAMGEWEIIEKAPEGTAKEITQIRKAKTLSMFGAVFTEQGNYSKSLDYFIASLKIIENANDSNMLARLYGSLGNNYAQIKAFDKALHYFLNSIKISEIKWDLQAVATTSVNVANAYYNQGKFNEALEYSFKALEVNEQINDMRGKAYALTVIGNSYQEQREFDKSLEYYSKAEIIADEMSDGFLYTTLLVNIGAVYLFKKEYIQAETYLNSALKLSEKNSLLNLQKESHGFLATLFEEKGNFKKAIEHFRESVIAKDSLFNVDKTKEITQMEMSYEQDKKDAIAKAEQDKKDGVQLSEIQRQKLLRNSIAIGSGIILLSSIFIFLFYKRNRDAEQKQKETFLSLQVSETEMKALRSQMNPHFIFNALQSIQSFLLKQKSEEANIYLLKFSKLMRAVLENSQYSEVSIKKDLQALELYMQLESIRLPHPFTYEFHIDESIDTEATTIPPLILQPFVENAIWHGLQQKPEPGHINIFISKQNGALHASVEDNGVGRDMSKAVQQPMLLKKQSLGMKLTEERLKILSETKKFQSSFHIIDLISKDNFPLGTRVDLSLPLGA